MSKLLERRAQYSRLSSTQHFLDQVSSQAVKDLVNPRSLAPVVLAGSAFRLARLASLSVGGKGFASAAGLTAEVFTYELSHRALQSLSTQPATSKLWKWEGDEGLKKGLLHSVMSFGLLRAAGVLTANHNIFIRHSLQNISNVAAQDIASQWGITAPQGNYLERFIQSEILNLQMMAGLKFYHQAFPALSLREASWESFAHAKLHAFKASFSEFPQGLKGMASQEDAKLELKDLQRLEETFASALQDGDASPEIFKGLKRDFDQLRDPSQSGSLERDAAVQRLSSLALHLYLSEKYAAEALFFQRLKVYEGEIQGSYRAGPYRYHPSAELPPPPPNVYQGKTRVWMDQLERQLRQRGESLELTGGVSAQKNPVDPDLVNRIWMAQLLDFAAQVKARVSLHDAQILLEPFDARGKRSEASLLNLALAEMDKENLSPEARQVFELIIPHSEVIFGHNRPKAIQIDLGWALGRMEMVLNRQVRLAYYEQDSQLVLRIMSPSLFEKLLQAHFGKSATSFYYVPGEISRKSAIQLREQGMAPIGIVKDPLILNDIAAYIPAWFFAFHDIYHATVLSTYPDAMRRFSGRVFRAAQSEALWANLEGQEHFRRLIDFDSDPQALHSHTVAYLSKTSDRELVKTKNASAVLEARLKFVEAYEHFLRTKIEASPERESLLRELGEVSKSLRSSHAKNRWLRLLGYQIHYPSNSEP